MVDVTRVLTTLALAAALLSACATSPPATAVVGEPATDVAEDGTFRLELRLPRATFASDEVIEPVAELTYLGPAAEVVATGSGSGPVLFGLRQLDGRREMGPAATGDCAPHPFVAGEPGTYEYTKSGGYADDDPDAAFYRAFFGDPELHLPPGRWRVTASIDLSTAPDGCGDPWHHIEASLEFVVTP